MLIYTILYYFIIGIIISQYYSITDNTVVIFFCYIIHTYILLYYNILSYIHLYYIISLQIIICLCMILYILLTYTMFNNIYL